MQAVAVLEKVYGGFSPKTFEPFFSSVCEGLKVRIRVVGKTKRGWIRLEVSGEDEIAALHIINKEIGLAPTSLDKLKRFSVIRGRIFFSGRSKTKLYVDVGVSSPETYDAVIPVPSLQAHLADGKNLSIQRLVGLFCLYENLPLKVKVLTGVNAQNKIIESELSEAQLSQIKRWIGSGLDRLIVLGAPLSDVAYSVKASKHSRDIVRIETLGLLEHAVLCKLGTDAIGLVPKLGRFLTHATLAPFRPAEIKKLIDRYASGSL